MKKCPHCNSEMLDGAVFCVSCGKQVPNTLQPAGKTSGYSSKPTPEISTGYSYKPKQEKPSTPDVVEAPGLANWALALAFFSPWIGLALSILGIIKYKDKRQRKKSFIALAIAGLWVFILVGGLR